MKSIQREQPVQGEKVSTGLGQKNVKESKRKTAEFG